MVTVTYSLPVILSVLLSTKVYKLPLAMHNSIQDQLLLNNALTQIWPNPSSRMCSPRIETNEITNNEIPPMETELIQGSQSTNSSAAVSSHYTL